MQAQREQKAIVTSLTRCMQNFPQEAGNASEKGKIAVENCYYFSKGIYHIGEEAKILEIFVKNRGKINFP